MTNAEEEVMKYLWQLERAFMKDLVDAFEDPKPAYTTIATVLKRLIKKNIVGYKQYGKVREYYPLVKKTDYFSNHINTIKKNFFNNSASQFASFYTNNDKISLEELKALRSMINQQIKDKKND